HIWTMIADENNERAVRPAHIGKRVGFSVGALERKVTRLPAEVANAVVGQSHHESSATQAVRTTDNIGRASTLLDGREQPIAAAGAHEGPQFGDLARLAAFDDAAAGALDHTVLE